MQASRPEGRNAVVEAVPVEAHPRRHDMVWTEAVSDAVVCVHHSFCGEGNRDKFICSSPGPNDNSTW
eukprot:9249605-Pyramimonas_sp.AAC.1